METLRALGEVSFIPCDVFKAADCAQVVETVIRQYGRIDILVNVAGVVGEHKAFTEIDLRNVSDTIGINLMGIIYLSYYTAREIVKVKSGVIVNAGSICGHMANTESIGYHASKGGVRMLTRAMARELSPYGIRTVEVVPGWVRTGMIDPEIEEIGSRLHMKGRILEPEEIAGAIYLVTLPEASAINGSTIMADDGYASFKGVDSYQAQHVPLDHRQRLGRNPSPAEKDHRLRKNLQ